MSSAHVDGAESGARCGSLHLGAQSRLCPEGSGATCLPQGLELEPGPGRCMHARLQG